jgi:primosomal protein N' (replication factor Y)
VSAKNNAKRQEDIMAEYSIARVAVSAATYWIDRPYDYNIPAHFAGLIVPGMRVSVPFARSNRRTEGIVLALAEESTFEKRKAILAVLDQAPVLTEAQLKLAFWMRERYFCTVFDAAKAMLPAGLWFQSNGARKVKDKYLQMAQLRIPAEEAMELAHARRMRAPHQADILEVLCAAGQVSVSDLREFTGAPLSALQRLVQLDLIQLDAQEAFRRPEYATGDTMEPPILNQQQQEAYEGLVSLLHSGKASVALLFGVTGSGKTTIYVRLILDVIATGKSAILLVPEIALTPQMLYLFSSYFGDMIAVLHSSLTMAERYDEWKRIKAGVARVIIGTRSAIFAPVDNLGIVIIDEEQEDTYKSDNAPRYHAREIAKYLCVKANTLLLMGSATPDIESRYKAEQGIYHYFSLSQRYNQMGLPSVRIVDMREELRHGNGTEISSVLQQDIAENIQNGQQTILFLNRRGTSQIISCGECGYTYECPHCSVHLTYHGANRRLICHYCGYSRRMDERCPTCGGKLNHIGAGTQKVVEELEQLFPGTEILRMDTDTVTAAGGHQALLDRFQRKKIPIMVGTQMVTKGLNFDTVTLVGVLSADQSLYAGNYKANERTFSLITQVVGRSGRGKLPGRAVIQTFTPENQVILRAARQDYEGFYQEEIKLRQVQNAPPFVDLISLNASGIEEDRVLLTCSAIKSILIRHLGNRETSNILGPAPLGIVRVNNRFRYRVLLACQFTRTIGQLISEILTYCNTEKTFKGVSVYADLNPSE